jgi:hypothetical protein
MGFCSYFRKVVLAGSLLVFTAVFFFSRSFAGPEFQKYRFILNGSGEKTFDCIVVKEVTLVPLYEIAPLLGCTVEKCNDCKMDTLYLNKTVTSGPEDKILFKWESDLMSIGEFKSGISRLNAKTVRLEGKTYLSLEAFERIGFRVEEEPGKRVIKIWKNASKTLCPQATG